MHRTLPFALALASAVAAPAAAALAQAPDPMTIPAPPAAPEPPAVPEAPAAPEATEAPKTGFAADQVVTVNVPHRDLFALAQTIELLAPVSDNAFLMGQSAFVGAPVDGDVLAMGEIVEIGAAVAGDVYALGRQIQINREGSVGGDLFGAGAEIEVLGPIDGDFSGGAGSVRISAPISGDVELEVGELLFGDGASIGGDLTYEAAVMSDRAMEITNGDVLFIESADQKVKIVVDPPGEPGIRVHIDDDEIHFDHEPERAGIFSRIADWTFWRGWGFITKLIVGAAILVLGGATAGRVSGILREQPGPSLGVGVIVALALPAMSLISIVTIVGSPLGLLGLAAWFALMYVAQIFAAVAIGDVILEQIRPGAVGSPYVSMAVGLVPLVILSSLPWFGWLVWFAAVLVGLGAMWLTYRPGTVEQTV